MQVLALWWEGLDLHALVKILPTKAGSLVRQLYEAGGAVGGSCRGWGSLALIKTPQPAHESSQMQRFISQDYELLA